MKHVSVFKLLPTADQVRRKLGYALREVEMLRRLLRIAERADLYRARDQEIAQAKQSRQGRSSSNGRVHTP